MTASCNFLFLSFTQAQEIPISFKVINGKKEPVPFFSITVVNRLDSTQIIKKGADSSGVARINLARLLPQVRRAPFVLEGLAQGALGGGAAALLLALARWFLREPLSQALPASAAGIGSIAVITLIIAPSVAGGLSAWWAVESVLRRHARLER